MHYLIPISKHLDMIDGKSNLKTQLKVQFPSSSFFSPRNKKLITLKYRKKEVVTISCKIGCKTSSFNESTVS